ncbi:O-antigen polymerase [Acinetobacter zhairhuonensis]|uniref:O-antigen polymerase n=1 Tax=Acinetobacter sp. A7.4 TaxID=2919921 RepID=UPI001F4FB9A5|nr:O-antigen polymerase [Acinetobacter sp. A7.4]MCJ8161549.1 oligosaccharide repeat unit polymerase [Acinetobacter sp. A7.4]
MQLLILIIAAYLFMPVIGELYLLLSGDMVVAGDVTWQLFVNNLIYALIVFSIVFFLYLKKEINLISFLPSTKDTRSLRRMLVIMIIFCCFVFIFSGYDYLFKGQNRGDIRVGFGPLGFLYKWITIYATPLIILLTTIIFITNKKISKKICYVIYFLGVLSAFFTGYKFVVIFTLIPVFLLLFYKKNIIKVVLYITPIVLVILTFTTRQVMNYSSYNDAFYFIIHRMTVMSAFGTIGVWNYFANGVDIDQSSKLLYNLFGNTISEHVFGLKFNSVDVLDSNLSRKITYMVYPNWEKAISGTTNVTVTNFGEAVYILGSFYWIYAIFSGVIISFFLNKIDLFIYKGDILRTCMYYIFTAAVILSWLNSSSFLTLFSFPVFLYMIMSYCFLKFILNTKIV